MRKISLSKRSLGTIVRVGKWPHRDLSLKGEGRLLYDKVEIGNSD